MKLQIAFLAAALLLVSQQSHAGLNGKAEPVTAGDTAATIKGAGTAAVMKNTAIGTSAVMKDMGTAEVVKKEQQGAPGGDTATVSSAAGPAPASVNREVGTNPSSSCPLINASNVDLFSNTTPKTETTASAAKAPTLQ